MYEAHPAGATAEWTQGWYGLVFEGHILHGDNVMFAGQACFVYTFELLWTENRSLTASHGTRETAGAHGVSLAEIESLFRGVPGVYDDPDHSEQEPRLRAIGQTDAGRYVFVAFTIREEDSKTLIRPISARYMHEKEIQHYERQKTP